MKKLLAAMVIFLFSNLLFAGEQAEVNPRVNVSLGLQLVPESLKDKNKDLKYKIDLKYPQLSGSDMDPAAKNFNDDIKQIVDTDTSNFKGRVAASAAATKDLPKDVQQNEFDLVYGANVFKAGNVIVLSIRLKKEYFYAGSAHGTHSLQVYNYDFSTGKRLQLSEIFQPNSDYLDVLSKYCRKMLPGKIENGEAKWIVNGTEPRTSNFANWNLRPDGVMITFDEYQVAAYVDGQPELLVPYKALEKVISPQAIIANCVKNSADCTKLT